MSPTVAWFTVMTVVTVVNFLLSRSWAFRSQPAMTRTIRLVAVVFAVALLVRLGLLLTVFDHLQHGSAPHYASAALGLHHGAGLTIDTLEVQSMLKLPSNVSGDYRTYFRNGEREPFTEFLPGPAVLLALFWKLIPVYNFGPYLIFQVIIDALLIAAFALLMMTRHRLLSLLTVAVMIVNLAVIKRTLMMGYDFWPQFGVLVVFLGVLALQDRGYRSWLFVLVGLLASIPVWFRDITTFLPVVVAVFLVYTLRKKERFSWRATLGRVTLFLAPIILSVALLSLYRYETTGNFRPTRSTFWHSFMAGVGQFSNPYGLEHSDDVVWEFGQKINPALRAYTVDEMYRLPNSPYENTLREVALQFVRERPDLFIRNFVYRIGMMIAPVFYADGDFIPRSVASMLYPLGFVLLPLWCIGMLYLRKTLPFVFGLAVAIYCYFFLAFGWFYVVGRVILPFFFVSTLVWMAGILAVAEWIRSRRPRAV
jgi:hypothetical protein